MANKPEETIDHRLPGQTLTEYEFHEAQHRQMEEKKMASDLRVPLTRLTPEDYREAIRRDAPDEPPNNGPLTDAEALRLAAGIIAPDGDLADLIPRFQKMADALEHSDRQEEALVLDVFYKVVRDYAQLPERPFELMSGVMRRLRNRTVAEGPR